MSPLKLSCCLFGAGGAESSSSDESVRSITAAAGRLALVPPPGREDIAGLSRVSLMAGVPMLGGIDLFGVTEDLTPSEFTDEISRSSRSRLDVFVAAGAGRGDPATFHSAVVGSIVTCSRSLGVLDRMSRTYLQRKRVNRGPRFNTGLHLLVDS